MDNVKLLTIISSWILFRLLAANLSLWGICCWLMLLLMVFFLFHEIAPCARVGLCVVARAVCRKRRKTKQCWRRKTIAHLKRSFLTHWNWNGSHSQFQFSSGILFWCDYSTYRWHSPHPVPRKWPIQQCHHKNPRSTQLQTKKKRKEKRSMEKRNGWDFLFLVPFYYGLLQACGAMKTVCVCVQPL